MDESVLPEANPGSTPDFSEKSVVVTLRCLLHHGAARLELVALGGLVFPMKSVSGVLRSNSDYFLLKTQSMDFQNRAGGIRTRGLLNPIQALYQAEPRPVSAS